MRFAMFAGAYEVGSLPSQPQVAHCHGFHVRRELRGKGYGHTLKAHQNRTLRQLGYDFAVCTVCASNTAQKRILATGGWRELAHFVSSKTGERVELWGHAVDTCGGLDFPPARNGEE